MNETSKEALTRDLWKRAKQIYFTSVTNAGDRNQAERYFSMISSVDANGDTFCFSVSNSFAADLLDKEYSSKLKKCFHLAGASDSIKIVFKTSSVKREKTPEYEIPAVKTKTVAPEIQKQVNSYISTLPLNQNYTFDEFVVGSSNSWAHAAAKGVVENPGAVGYNPLFIHGGTGLGKTHLMQAIGNEIRKTNPSLAVCYITAETFLNEYINNLQNHTLNAFRDRYRKTDVLLVDDVQFLQRGEQCQEEFFNTFNALTGDHKQIVMTSDVAPKDLPKISERLISRFEGGMVQGIESPSYETRLAILRKKAEGMTTNIPDIAIKFIADKIKSHVRAMEGALAKVRVLVQMNPQESITEEMLSRLLKDFIDKEHAMKKLTLKEIQEVVANRYSVTLDQILSTERTQSIVTPRQLAMYIARKFTTKSLLEIAEVFEKTHATVVHGVKTIEKRLDVEPELKESLEEIVREMGLSSDI